MGELSDLNPEAMLKGFPPDWTQYEYRRVVNDIIGEYIQA